MATVTVEAAWRLSRVEFNTPLGAGGVVHGYGETKISDASGKSYGAMPGLPVTRVLADVMTETIEIDGKTIEFKTVVDALIEFMQKWQSDDLDMPPVVAPALTPVPTMPTPAKEGELPPPRV